MSERADQIVLDYLRRVADAAHGVLRSDERLEFLARLRRRIDEVRIRQRANKPVQVQRIIERLGAPETLVEQERLRLAAERPEDPPRPRTTGHSEPPRAATGADTANTTVVADPGQERPANETQPIPVLDVSAIDGGTDTPASYTADLTDEVEEPPGPDEPSSPEESSESQEAAEVKAATEPAPPSGDPPVEEGEEAEKETAATGEQGRTATKYPRRAAPSDVWTVTGRALPGATAARHSDFLDVAARNKLASVTVILLGFGALALPVPLWLLGVVLLVLCQAWPLGDKMLAAAAPIVTVAVYGLATDQAATVLAMSEYTSAGTGGPRLAFGIGGLLGAAYLGFRLSRTTR